MEPIRIIIADDHMMVREGLKQLLELDGSIEVIGQASEGEKCLELVNKLEPDVVLLDINMPNMNGLQALQKMFTAILSCLLTITAIIRRQSAQLLQATGSFTKDEKSLLILCRTLIPEQPHFLTNLPSALMKLMKLSSIKYIHRPEKMQMIFL